jgi:flavin reductase (DIM6/NTAB) family NADH-FMN oxidoreductase RutF
MAKKEIGAVACLYPIPAVIVGAKSKEKTDYTLLGNCGIISVSPAIIYISSDKKNFINSLIKKAKVFSVNVPSASLAPSADYCGIYSAKKTDKSAVFTAFFGAETGAPMAEECPVNIECRLKKTLKIEGMEVFIAEVVNSFVSEQCLTNGKPDIEKISPLIYDFAHKYRSIGKWNAEAGKIGKDFKKQAEKRAEKAEQTAKKAKKAVKKARKEAKKAKKENKAEKERNKASENSK